MIQFKDNIEPFNKPHIFKCEEKKGEKSDCKSATQIMRGTEHYTHQHLREVQRYGIC